MINGKSLVIWDWNGTLLNDTEACIASMNRMLGRRKMPRLTETRYRKLFRFPVEHYYTDLGFDFMKESFESLSVEFVLNYREFQHISGLQPGAVEVLAAFRKLGVRQIILSAMERSTLISDVTARGVEGFFDDILGLDDHYASGKTGIARQFLSTSAFPADEILLLGDTLHDHEVACILGCSCILIAHGHYPAYRLLEAGVPVYNNLDSILNLLINH